MHDLQAVSVLLITVLFTQWQPHLGAGGEELELCHR